MEMLFAEGTALLDSPPCRWEEFARSLGCFCLSNGWMAVLGMHTGSERVSGNAFRV